MTNEPRITLTLNEARVMQEILRYTTTSNPWVVNATVTMYNHLENQISQPRCHKDCTCR